MDNSAFYEDIEEVIQRAMDVGLKGFVIPGASFSDLPQAIKLVEKYENIYFAIGVHPYDAEEYNLETMKKYASHKKCIAIGECGLDYFRLPENDDEKEVYKNKQKEVFISQINFAKEVKKPLIVHIRDASQDAKDLLTKYADPKIGGILHCYNADECLLSLSESFYYGIGGVLTFKNAKKLVNIFPKIPKNRILIETDSPYLTPHPFRGSRNEPKYCVEIALKMAELLNIDEKELKSLIINNTKSIFKVFSSLS